MIDNFEWFANHTVRADEDYYSSIDEWRRGEDQLCFIHVSIKRFTPSVLRRVRREWQVLRACVECPLFAAGEVDDDKWERFVCSLGFQFLMRADCTDGQNRRIFVSFPKEITDVGSLPNHQ